MIKKVSNVKPNTIYLLRLQLDMREGSFCGSFDRKQNKLAQTHSRAVNNILGRTHVHHGECFFITSLFMLMPCFYIFMFSNAAENSAVLYDVNRILCLVLVVRLVQERSRPVVHDVLKLTGERIHHANETMLSNCSGGRNWITIIRQLVLRHHSNWVK